MLGSSSNSPEDRVVDVVKRLLAELSINRPVCSDDDLREVGLSSLDMVNLMLSVEAEFDLEIPEIDITSANFRSISAISNLVTTLLNNA
jgi:acyl carrier protein